MEISLSLDAVFNLVPAKWALLFLKTLFGPGGGMVVVPKFKGEVPIELAD